MGIKTKPKAKKKLSATEKDLCRMITPPFRVSYPHLFQPQAAQEGDKRKYQITMMFDKKKEILGSTLDGKPRLLKEIIRNAKIRKFGPKENWPDDLQSPRRDGDDPDYEGKDGYKGHWIYKASSNEDQKPGVVGRDGVPITEASELYPGCYARAYIMAYIWEHPTGGTGVGLILDHVQKVKDGKSFGGKKPVEQVFSPMADDDEEESVTEDEDDDL